MTLVPPRKLRVLVNSASGIGTVLVNVIFVFFRLAHGGVNLRAAQMTVCITHQLGAWQFQRPLLQAVSRLRTTCEGLGGG